MRLDGKELLEAQAKAWAEASSAALHAEELERRRARAAARRLVKVAKCPTSQHFLVESRGVEPGGFASELPNTSSLIEDPLGRRLAVSPPNPLQTATVVKTETRVLYLTETYKKLALELLHVAFLCDDLDLVLLLTDRRDRFQ